MKHTSQKDTEGDTYTVIITKISHTAFVAAVLRWWVAVDAPVDSDDRHVRHRGGWDGVFLTPEDALRPGWHKWETNYGAGQPHPSDWRTTGLSCDTVQLP